MLGPFAQLFWAWRVPEGLDAIRKSPGYVPIGKNVINELLASTYKLDRKESEMRFWILAALLSLNVALAEELQTQSSSDDVALAKNLEALAERLKDQPDNDKGWYMLGRSYLNMGNYEQSAAAFAHMLAKFKDDHSLSAYYAEALYMADGQIVTPRVAAAIEATLALNPMTLRC